MQKVQYDHKPLKLEAVGNGSYRYRWGIEEITRVTENGETESIWECYECVAWKNDRKEITRAAIDILRGSAEEEAKLINDFNAVNEGLLDESYKQPYLDYIQKRNELKAEIKAFFEG